MKYIVFGWLLLLTIVNVIFINMQIKVNKDYLKLFSGVVGNIGQIVEYITPPGFEFSNEVQQVNDEPIIEGEI